MKTRAGMKRVLLVHPHVRPNGGGQAVAAWALQALRDVCELSLLTWDAVDYEGVNRTFGTSLQPGDFQVHVCSPVLRAIAGRLPFRGELLKTSILMRQLKTLDRMPPYDVVLGTHDEMDFGRRGIQYVHYPHAYRLPEMATRRWFHRPAGMLGLYRWLCQRVSAVTAEGLCRNLTLVNSCFVAERVTEIHGFDSRVVYPPVPGDFPSVGWDDREDGFACLGRLAPVKQWTEAVEIVDGLRARGHAVQLHIIGTPEDSRYEAALRALARRRSEWMTLHADLSRAEMTALVARQRYGLHPQVGEHFGIAVAELVRAGCLTFVARPGGPVEIVGDEPALVFSTPAEAVDTIDRVLRDPDRRRLLSSRLAERRDLYSSERFMGEIRQVVDGFDSSPPSEARPA